MQVLQRPFLDGLMNITFFGIPTYIFVMIIFGMMIIFSEAAMWWFYWKPLEYMHGIYRAYWDKINACFIGDLSNRYELIPENKAKLLLPHEDYEAIYGCATLRDTIFPKEGYFFSDKPFLTRLSVWLGRKLGRNYDMLIAKELEQDIIEAPVVHANGIPIDMILDLDRWTHRNSQQRKELIRLVNVWNDANPEDQIHTYFKAYRYISEGKLVPNPGMLKDKIIIPWARIKALFVEEENEAIYAGYERQLAEDMVTQEANDYKKYFWGILGFFALVDILMLVAGYFKII